MRRILPFAAALFSAALAGAACAEEAESFYVICDNGLRCVTLPCPSSSAFELGTGRVLKGVSADIDGLSAEERSRVEQTDALFYGRLVLRGRIESRQTEILGRQHTLSYLVATAVEREATDDERRHCPIR